MGLAISVVNFRDCTFQLLAIWVGNQYSYCRRQENHIHIGKKLVRTSCIERRAKGPFALQNLNPKIRADTGWRKQP